MPSQNRTSGAASAQVRGIASAQARTVFQRPEASSARGLRHEQFRGASPVLGVDEQIEGVLHVAQTGEAHRAAPLGRTDRLGGLRRARPFAQERLEQHVEW